MMTSDIQIVFFNLKNVLFIELIISIVVLH